MKERPLCHWCGRALAKRVQPVFVVSDLSMYPGGTKLDHVQGPLHTREECQRVTNEIVTSVVRGRDRTIRAFNVWDGESYKAARGFFCTNACAMDMGRMACRNPHNLAGPGYLAAMRRQMEKANADVSPRL